MIKYFSNVYSFDGDFFVGDYTEYKKSHPAFKDVKGVLITSTKRNEIGFLHFHNKNNVKVKAINFEENPAFLKDNNGNLVSQCECFCVADKQKGKAWLAFVELKYCKGAKENIISNFASAINQVKNSHLFLRDDTKILEQKKFHIYWVISMPEHSDQTPFTAFAISQDDILSYKEDYGATIIGDTDVEILNSGFIRGMHRD